LDEILAGFLLKLKLPLPNILYSEEAIKIYSYLKEKINTLYFELSNQRKFELLFEE
jgi:hypothetical protein